MTHSPQRNSVVKAAFPDTMGKNKSDFPDQMDKDRACCLVLLSLIEGTRAWYKNNPCPNPDNDRSSGLALEQLDECEAWVKSKFV